MLVITCFINKWCSQYRKNIDNSFLSICGSTVDLYRSYSTHWSEWCCCPYLWHKDKAWCLT